MDRLCRNCKEYEYYDENFGFCWRYKNQAKHDDSCKTIKVMVE